MRAASTGVIAIGALAACGPPTDHGPGKNMQAAQVEEELEFCEKVSQKEAIASASIHSAVEGNDTRSIVVYGPQPRCLMTRSEITCRVKDGSGAIVTATDLPAGKIIQGLVARGKPTVKITLMPDGTITCS